MHKNEIAVKRKPRQKNEGKFQKRGGHAIAL